MNLPQILERASKLRIAVVGDLIIDKYIDGTIERISPEAPVSILLQKGTRQNPGGAGNVADNLKGLGVQVSEFYGNHVPVKTRVMAGNHHLIRIDEEESEPYQMRYDDYNIGLDYGIHHNKYDCVVISDYGKGAITSNVTATLIKKCNDYNIPVIVDSKKDFYRFKGSTVLKCNTNEWKEEKRKMPSMVEGHDLIESLSLEHFIITAGEMGLSLFYKYGGEGISGYPVNICDACGAGDTSIAVIAIMSAMKLSMLEACELANIAASEVCRWPGVKPITKELLIKRYNEVYGSKI